MIWSPKLIGAGVVLAVVVITGLYINNLKGNIEKLKVQVAERELVIKEQKSTILALTQSKEDVQKKLEVAEKKSQEIRERVVVRLKRVPAAPVQCEPALDWLRDRAIELQGDKS